MCVKRIRTSKRCPLKEAPGATQRTADIEGRRERETVRTPQPPLPVAAHVRDVAAAPCRQHDPDACVTITAEGSQAHLRSGRRQNCWRRSVPLDRPVEQQRDSLCTRERRQHTSHRRCRMHMSGCTWGRRRRNASREERRATGMTVGRGADAASRLRTWATNEETTRGTPIGLLTAAQVLS